MDTEDIIEEIASSLAVEHMIMTDEEKDNLRRVAHGELTYRELIDRYVTEAKRIAAHQD